MTDPAAVGQPELNGDAHEHLKNNDCGLTAGALFSGAAVAEHHAHKADRERAIRLRRLSPALREAVCMRCAH